MRYQLTKKKLQLPVALQRFYMYDVSIAIPSGIKVGHVWNINWGRDGRLVSRYYETV